MYRWLFLFLFFLKSTDGYSHFSFHLEITTSTLNNKSISFCILNNAKNAVVYEKNLVFHNNKIVIEGDLMHPISYARLSIKLNGKSKSCDFVVDTGSTNFQLEFTEIPYKKLTISGLHTRSYQIYRSLTDIVERHFKEASRKTGNINELTLHADSYREMLIEQIDYLKGYPDDVFSVLALYYLSRFEKSRPYTNIILKRWESFSDVVKESAMGIQLHREVSDLLAEIDAGRNGKIVPYFTVDDINNKLFSNVDLKGKAYLIVFSATWCLPCQKKLPLIKNVYERYKGKGLEVIYFNDDADTTRWKNHVEKNKLNWINVSERLNPHKSKIPKLFGVYAIPTCILVGTDEVIKYNSDQEDQDLNQLENKVKELIN